MKSENIISRLRIKYATQRSLETIFFGLGGGLLIWALTFGIAHNNSIAIASGILALVTIAFIRVRQLGLLSLNSERIAFFLNREFPALKDSTDLVLRPQSSLSGLAQIQVERVSTALSQLERVRLPHLLPWSAIFLLVTVFIAFASFRYLPQKADTQSNMGAGGNALDEPTASVTPAIDHHQLTVRPPSYTQMKAMTTEHLSARVPEGSNVSWRILFTSSVDRAWLQFTNGDSIAFKETEGGFISERSVTESLIYRIRWSSSDQTHSSDYFELTSKPDQPPTVQIRGLEQFTRLKWGEKASVDVKAFLHDDFGLTQGHIIATVSKGSGESVKFREEKLPFQSPAKISGKDVKASRRLDFKALGMEPGDEVYFYAEAWDNKNPDPQRNRTETFFISLQDTASQVITTDASLGVDLMPDYFRSQRQIIIDTEKLLKDKPNLSRHAFNSTSNELGYDQKVLRLKYGQFLGEEFETTIGEHAHEEAQDDEESDEDDPAKKYAHQHDKDNEHNLVAPKKPDAGHEESEDPAEAYKHNHDNMEEATFFTISVKAKLKAALTLMWEAELQLRLFAPKESLPIQYKILNLLREISQDSRIYVHRMGFDPPPLKEDRRLTGDLEEIGNPNATSMPASSEKYPSIRAALVSIGAALEQNPPEVSISLKSRLEAAAVEIAAASLEHPGDYLIQLSQIRAIIDGTIKQEEIAHALADIQSACWNILPSEQPGPHQDVETRHTLDSRLLEELKKPANE